MGGPEGWSCVQSFPVSPLCQAELCKMVKEADKGKVSMSTLGQMTCAALLSPVQGPGVGGGGCAGPGVGGKGYACPGIGGVTAG